MALSPKAKPYVRALVDYGGLVVFVVAYFVRLRVVTTAGPIGWALAMGGHAPRDLVGATWWLVGASAIALLVGLIAERRMAPMPMISGGFALAFGCMTLFFHDPRFLKIKPTVANLAFGLALLGGLIMRKNPLGWLLGDSLPLPNEAWRKLTLRYAVFFFAMAALNEAIWRTQPDAIWVLFRMPGLLVLALLFSVAQAPFMMKYLHTDGLPPPPSE